MKLSFVFIVLSTFVYNVENACDYCQPGNSVACHSDTVFSLCIDGIATHDYITCPPNSVCTSEPLVCYARDIAVSSCARDDITPDVDDNQCGVCDETRKLYSCINETTMAFCFGNNLPLRDALANCPENSVCDLNSRQFCSDASNTRPSCSSNDVTTDTTTEITSDPTTVSTTPSAPPTPTEACKDLGSTGSFKNEYDPTCTTFFMCWQDSTGMKGMSVNCPAGMYFDEVSRVCGVNKPDDCI